MGGQVKNQVLVMDKSVHVGGIDQKRGKKGKEGNGKETSKPRTI